MIERLPSLRRALALAVAVAANASCSNGAVTAPSDGGGSGGSSGGRDGSSIFAGGGTAGGATLDGGGLPAPSRDAGAACDPAPAHDILDTRGAVDPARYRAVALLLGGTDGIDYRYGPSATCWHPSPEVFGKLYQPADHHFDNHGNGSGWDYEVAGPQDATKNDYSSNMAQVLYVADEAGDQGVDTLTTLLMGENTFSEKPQLPWVYYGGGHPEPNLKHDAWTQANGGAVTTPVALGRSYGYEGWGVESILAFASGFIGTAGSNTADNDTFAVLPPHKVPTSVAVTDNNEFALVTVWDTDAVKGQIAVFALGTGNKFWNDWQELYPGLRNKGLWTFIKLLGFIDLPDIVAPTEISASTDSPASGDDSGWLVSPDGTNGRMTESDLTLSVEANRQSFVTGPNASRYSKGGFAVVISKSERKAAFIDLKPLFDEVRTMYFGTLTDFGKTKTTGQADAEWPFSFTVAPASQPVVVKTLALGDRPTAVRTSLSEGVNQAYVATEDGTLTIYGVGGYGDANGGTPDDIRPVGTVRVGRNPTSIAYAKNHGWGTPDHLGHELIVVSRGDRRIDWMTLSGPSGTITKTLTDVRLIDPIWAEDNDNHGTESYLLTTVDHEGKQVLNYRYGPVVFHTNGGAQYDMGPNGKDPFELGGIYAVAGRPFQVSGANVP